MKIHGPVIADGYVPDISFDVSDGGPPTYEDVTRLTFNPTHFYLTNSSSSTPIVNLRPVADACLLFKSDNQSITSGAGAVDITWTAPQYDIGGWFNPASPTGLTVPGTGEKLIRITAVITWVAGTGTPNALARISNAVERNGADLIGDSVQHVINAANSTITNFLTVGLHSVSGGDVFTINAATTFTTTLSMSILGSRSYFLIELIDATRVT